MPAKGRELHDVRAALARLLDRYPANRRRALDDDVRAVLGHAEAIVKATEPVGRGDDGEPSPGERVAQRGGSEGRGQAVWDDAAAKLNQVTGRGQPHRRGDGTYNEDQSGGDAYQIKMGGSEKGKRRSTRYGPQHMTDV